jgi:hypothetical protein
MSDDDFIRGLRADWCAQQVDKGAAVLGRLRRGRWTPSILMGLEVLQGVVGLLGGAAFLWIATSTDRLADWMEPLYRPHTSTEVVAGVFRIIRYVFALSGVVMLVSVPALTWMAVRARRGGLRWEDETPEGVLRAGVRRAESSLRANLVGRWNLAALLVFVVALWALAAVGLAPVWLIAELTVFYLGVIAGAWLWLDLRLGRVRKELDTCVALLSQYEASEGAVGP